MSDVVLAKKNMPYCPGCGHGVVTRHMGSALSKLGVDPLDVVVVSDIGCCGLIDGLLRCHTLHGLHGRAVALAMGVRFGLGANEKKVIAVQGDGGATIGLQHLLEAARRNVNMTLVVHNNMVYGMTGGQLSGLSSPDFKHEEGDADAPPYDICELAMDAGASFAARAFAGRDPEELWLEALGTEGFALIEIVEMCPAYGIGKLNDLQSVAEYPAVKLSAPRDACRVPLRSLPSLFEPLDTVSPQYPSMLRRPTGIVLAGSAGEGIQSTGQLLATAGMLAGLHATKKGEYPITVGTGFSVAEVILSPQPIRYTGIDYPDAVIVVSENGLDQVRGRLSPQTDVCVDETLRGRLPHGARAAAPFRTRAGAKGAALAATARWLRTSGALPVEALIAAIRQHPQARSLRRAIDFGLS